MDIFNDIEGLVMEAIDKHHSLHIAGVINFILNRNDRGNIIKEFCASVSLNIEIGNMFDDASDMWIWRSSSGNLERICYIFHSKVLRSFDVSANRELYLGSDRRCVSASIE